MKSLYETLGIHQTASVDEIKTAYRRAAMLWHPDRNPGNIAEAETRFKELAHAYTVLSDSARRAAYDAAMFTKTAGAREEPQDVPENDADAVFLKAMYELAALMAVRGYNRDVLMGALLSQGCPERVAIQIAADIAARYVAAQRTAKGPFDQQPPKAQAATAEKRPPGNSKATVLVMLVLVGIYLYVIGPGQNERRGPQSKAVAANSPVPTSIPKSKTLADILKPQVEGFDSRTGVGRIVYSSLPRAEMFNGHREYLGKPYEIRLIQTIRFRNEPRQLLFFSSKPIGNGKDAFECHACAPLLSAMLLDDRPANGLVVVLPLQPLGPSGGWGKINLEGGNLPVVVPVGPAKNGFILKDGYLGQGYISEWGTIHSIEVDGFKELRSFELHSDGFGSSQCDGKDEADCPQKDTQFRFEKSSVHFGYFDIAVAETSVEVDGDAIKRAARRYTLRFGGTEYKELK